MSYDNKINEINAKLNALKQSGGVSRPLTVYGENPAAASTQSKRFDEILGLIYELKSSASGTGIGALLGTPDSGKTRTGYLLDNIVKQNTVDTVNAVYDFYDRFRIEGVSADEVLAFGRITQEVMAEDCHATELIRLSDKTKLPLKKRQRLNKFAEISGADTAKAIKKLPELLILKNELEGYLNEKKNESDYKKLAKKAGLIGTPAADDISDELRKFCCLQISDILEPPVIGEKQQDGESPTIFGLLEVICTDLFILKSETDAIKAAYGAGIGEIKAAIKNLTDSNVKILKEIKALKSEPPADGDNTYGSLLDELSSLKDDIKTALTFDKD